MKDFFCDNSAFIKCKKDFESDRLSHAYLFLSEDSFTNVEFSKYFLQFILCEFHSNCQVCEACVKLNKESHPDVFVFPKEKNIVVEDTEKIIDESLKSNMIAKYKIFVLNNFDNATIQAQNKLLKILEEPPKNVVFILNATNKSKVLQTILSRVKQVELQTLKRENLKTEISKFCNHETLDFILDFGDGWLGKTINLAKDPSFVQNYELALDIVTKMKSSKEIIFYSTKLASDKNSFVLKLEILASFFRKILLFKQTDCEIETKLKNVSSEYSVKALSKIMEDVLKAKKQIDFNVNQNLIADNLLMKILEDKYLWK